MCCLCFNNWVFWGFLEGIFSDLMQVPQENNSLPTSENGWAKLCCFLLMKLFHLFLKLFLSPETVVKGVANWLLFWSSLLQCNCQRYSELQELIIKYKKLLSSLSVNTKVKHLEHFWYWIIYTGNIYLFVISGTISGCAVRK